MSIEEQRELIKKGTIVIYVPNLASMSNEDIPIGSLGIFFRYSPGWQKYLPGLEPLEVIFLDQIRQIYRDEIEIVK